jgi:hypothetical protein
MRWKVSDSWLVTTATPTMLTAKPHMGQVHAPEAPGDLRQAGVGSGPLRWRIRSRMPVSAVNRIHRASHTVTSTMSRLLAGRRWH